ncbi:MAG: EamA family transporter [Chloroflexi bacterium]|jgi:drug/metabolite transporter (DMT)-like permease|nr:EamA family transporter [Chloroflexota bacterium]
MYYISAVVAIIGAVGYQFFVKRVPNSLNPIVSVIAMYVAVLAIGVVLLTLFPANGGLLRHFRQLSWIQLALAVSIMMIELGFLLMYRYGWNLSTGNLVTGVFVNIILISIGVTLLGEKMNLLNAIGFVLCILGVALISYRS